MSRPLLKLFALALTLVSPLAAQDSEWAALLARDEHLSFTSRTELAALTALDSGGLDRNAQAAALFALGASGSTRVRATLEDALAVGSLQDRCAAVLGLGEMGGGVRDLLESLREDPEPLVAECALLALMRTGGWAAAEYVEAVAESGDDAHAQMAGQLLLFATDAPASEATAASRLLLDLRWRAAQRFGLVDGQAWSVLLLDELARDPAFVKSMALQAAARLGRIGMKDHFLSILGVDQSDSTLRAVLRAMPEEVSQLVESGLWTPADRRQWSALLGEITVSRLEGSTRGLLVAATGVPSMRHRATSLLIRGGDQSYLAGILAEVEAGDMGAGELAWCCEMLGSSGNAQAAAPLRALSEHTSEAVAWSARINLARLGDRTAIEAVSNAMSGDSSSARALVVRLVNRWASDPTLAGLLAEALPSLEGALALESSITLIEVGRPSSRGRLREFLADGLPGGELGARSARALALEANEEDLEYLRHQFPLEGDVVVNEALALVLIETRDPIVVPLIRAVIWDGGFNESVLASGLLLEVSGPRALFDEIERAPLGGTEEDVRRIGYALGLWGGIPALRELTGQFRSGDPALQGALLGALASRTH